MHSDIEVFQMAVCDFVISDELYLEVNRVTILSY